MSGCLKGFREDESEIFLGDLDMRVGDVKIDGVIAKYWVPGVNESGEQMVKMCVLWVRSFDYEYMF